MNRQPHVDEFLRCGALAAGLLFAGIAQSATPPSEVASAAAPAPATGIYTGELSRGGPVYRLPPVQVIAYRKTEPARIERDQRMRQTGVKATRPAV